MFHDFTPQQTATLLVIMAAVLALIVWGTWPLPTDKDDPDNWDE